MAIINRKDAKLIKECTVQLDKSQKYESVRLHFYETEHKNWVSMALKLRNAAQGEEYEIVVTDEYADPNAVEVINADTFVGIMSTLFPSLWNDEPEPAPVVAKPKEERVTHLATTTLEDKKTGLYSSLTLYRSDETGEYSLGLVGFAYIHMCVDRWPLTVEEAKKVYRKLQEKKVPLKEAFPREEPKAGGAK